MKCTGLVRYCGWGRRYCGEPAKYECTMKIKGMWCAPFYLCEDCLARWDDEHPGKTLYYRPDKKGRKGKWKELARKDP